MERRSVDLVALCAEAVHTASTVGPDWPVTFHASGPIEVVGDATSLRQVIDNLLGNVRAHTPPGTDGPGVGRARGRRRGDPGGRRRSGHGRPTRPPTSSSASTGPTPAGPGPTAAPDSACPSSVPSWPPTAARSRPRTGRRRHRRSPCTCRSLPPPDAEAPRRSPPTGSGPPDEPDPTALDLAPGRPRQPGEGLRPHRDRRGRPQDDSHRQTHRWLPRSSESDGDTVTVMSIAHLASSAPGDAPSDDPGGPADVEIVVPVYNEAEQLAASITALRDVPRHLVPARHHGHHRRQRQHRRHLADRHGSWPTTCPG